MAQKYVTVKLGKDDKFDDEEILRKAKIRDKEDTGWRASQAALDAADRARKEVLARKKKEAARTDRSERVKGALAYVANSLANSKLEESERTGGAVTAPPHSHDESRQRALSLLKGHSKEYQNASARLEEAKREEWERHQRYNRGALQDRDIHALVKDAYDARQKAHSMQSGNAVYSGGNPILMAQQGKANQGAEKAEEEYNKIMQAIRAKGFDADGLLDTYTRNVNAENNQTMTGNIKDTTDKHTAGMSAASIALTPMEGAAALEGIKANIAARGEWGEGDNKYIPIDTNSPYFAPTNAKETIREAAGEKIEKDVTEKTGNEKLGKAASFAYDTGMSMGDSAIALTLPGAAGSVMLGTSAYASTLKDATERGLSADKANETALAAGIAEAAMEALSIDKLKGMSVTDADGFVKGIAKQMLTEGSEEFNTDIVNAVTDQLINGDMSELSQQKQAYIDSGMTEEEANKAVAINFGKRVGLDFIGGALSGGIFGAGGASVSAIGTAGNFRAAGQELQQQGPAAVQQEINTGLSMNNKSRAYQAAVQLNQNLRRNLESDLARQEATLNPIVAPEGTAVRALESRRESLERHAAEKMSARQLGRLQYLNTQEGTRSGFREAVQGAENESRLNRAMDKVVRGRTMSAKEVSEVRQSPAALDYINSEFGTDYTAETFNKREADMLSRVFHGDAKYNGGRDLEQLGSTQRLETVAQAEAREHNESTAQRPQVNSAVRVPARGITLQNGATEYAGTVESVDSKTGEVKIRTSAGEVVSTGDIQFNDAEAAKVYDFAKYYTTEEARSLVAGYFEGEESISAGDYINGFVQVRAAAKRGADFNEAYQAAQDYGSSITPAQAHFAYYAGSARTEAQENNPSGTEGATSLYTREAEQPNRDLKVKDSKRKRTFREALHAEKKAGATVTAQGKLTHRARQEVKFLDAFGKKYSVEFIIVDSTELVGYDEANGMYVRGKVVLPLDATGGFMSVYGGHELFHYVEENAGEKAQTLKRFIIERLKADAAYNYDAAFAKISADYGFDKLNDAEQKSKVESEMAGNACFSVLAKRENVEALVKEDRSLMQKIVDFFSEFLTKIENALQSLAGSNAEYRSIHNDIEAQKQMVAMMRECLNAARNVNSESINNGEVKYAINFVEEENRLITKETKFIVAKIKENYELIPHKRIFEEKYTDITKYYHKSDFVLEIFDEQNNAAYNPEIGTVELMKRGAKSTMLHGYGDVKIATVKAIKPIIEAGKVITHIENYNNADTANNETPKDRYIIAGRGTIEGVNGIDNVILGVMVESFPTQKHNSKFYLHEAVIIEEAESPITTVSPSEKTVGNSASKSIISNDEEKSNTKFSRRGSYMQAAEQGDEATAQKYVDEAAMKWGAYSVDGKTPLKLYHGTQSFGFTEFDLNRMDDKRSIFLTSDLETAASYSSSLVERNIRLNPSKYSLSEIVDELNNYSRSQRYRVVNKAYIDNWERNTRAMAEYGVNIDEYLPRINAVRSKLQGNEEIITEIGTANAFNRSEVEHLLIDEDKRSARNGNYSLYAKFDKPLVVDCKGANWNKIPAKGFEFNAENGKPYRINYTTTRVFAKYASEHGYDGIIFKNIVDNGGKGIGVITPADYIAVAFKPENVKSADAVTYDNNDEIIPVEKRFSESKDIRYSRRKAVDSEGNTLSEQQAEYFKDSKVRDEDGNLLVLYHGTDADFTVFDRNKGRQNMDIQGMFFSPWDIDARGYGPKVKAYYLNITNPAPEGTGYKALNMFKGQNGAGVKAREYLESLGYDGVNNGNEEFIAFYPNQIKLIDNDNPTDSDDIRYARREKLTQEQRDIRDLTRQNPTLSDAYMALKEALRIAQTENEQWRRGELTNRRFIDRDYVHTLARDFLKKYGSKYDLKTFEGKLQELYEYIANAGTDINNDYIFNTARDIAKNVIEHSGYYDTELRDQYADLRRYIRGTKLYVSDSIKSGIPDYNDWRTHAFGRLRLTNDPSAMSVDQLFKEVAEEAPGFFDADAVGEEQLYALYDFFDATAPVFYDGEDIGNQMGYSAEEFANVIAGDIFDSYFDTPEIKNAAKAYKQELQQARAEYRESIEALEQEYQERYRERIDELTKDAEEKGRKLEQAEKKLIEQKAHFQQSTRKAKERERRSQLLRSIKRQMNSILQRAAKPDAKKHLPNSINGMVKELVSFVRLEGSSIEERKLKGLLGAFKEGFAMSKDDMGNSEYARLSEAYTDFMEPIIEALDKEYGGMMFKQLPNEALEDVNALLKYTVSSINNINKAFLGGRTADINTLVGGIKSELAGKAKPEMRHLGREFFYNSMKPEYFFQFVDSGTLYKLWRDVRSGEDKYGVTLEQAKQKLDAIRKKHGYSDWEFDKLFDVKFDNVKDGPIKMSLGEILGYYANTRGDHTHNHIYGDAKVNVKGGGIVFVQDEKRYKNGGSKFFKVKNKRNYNQSIMQTEGDIARLIGMLTEEQRAYVDEVIHYLSTDIGALGNEVSRQLYDIEFYKEQHYYPAKVSSKNRTQQSKELRASKKLKNPSFSKQIIEQAHEPIELFDFDYVIAEHIEQMAKYNALAIPLDTFDRVFNHHESMGSGQRNYDNTKSYIENAYGLEATKYISTLMDDINGNIIPDSRASSWTELTAMFKKNAVFASASVTVQQPSAIGRAMSELDMKYFMTGSPVHKWGWAKNTYAELKAYAPIAFIKEMGYFDTNMSRSAIDYLNQEDPDGLKDKVKAFFSWDSAYRDEVFGWTAGKADEITWCHIWEACKKEAKEKHPDYSDEQMKQAAGKRFTDIIVKTQVYDSVFSRNALMRSKNDLLKGATAFMAEPTTALNMFVNSVIQRKRGNISNKKFARTLGSLVLASALNSALQTMVTAARHDDDDDEWYQLYIAELIPNFLDNLNPLNQITFVKDVINIFKGYDVERADLALFVDLYKAVQKLDSESATPEQKLYALSGALGAFVGVPIKNVWRDVKAVYNMAHDLVEHKAYREEHGEGKKPDGDELKEKVLTELGVPNHDYDRMMKAIDKGDTEKYNQYAEKVYSVKSAGKAYDVVYDIFKKYGYDSSEYKKAVEDCTRIRKEINGVKEPDVEDGVKSRAIKAWYKERIKKRGEGEYKKAEPLHQACIQLYGSGDAAENAYKKYAEEQSKN